MDLFFLYIFPRFVKNNDKEFIVLTKYNFFMILSYIVRSGLKNVAISIYSSCFFILTISLILVNNYNDNYVYLTHSNL